MRRLLESQQDSDAEEFVQSMKIDMFDDEVFVYTPKGRIVSLPAGSTPIDFAYAIHSGVGNSMIGAKMAADTLYMDPEDKEALLQAGSRCFNTQMDGFLGLLRAARDGVTMWPMPKTT